MDLRKFIALATTAVRHGRPNANFNPFYGKIFYRPKSFFSGVKDSG